MCPSHSCLRWVRLCAYPPPDNSTSALLTGVGSVTLNLVLLKPLHSSWLRGIVFGGYFPRGTWISENNASYCNRQAPNSRGLATGTAVPRACHSPGKVSGWVCFQPASGRRLLPRLRLSPGPCSLLLAAGRGGKGTWRECVHSEVTGGTSAHSVSRALAAKEPGNTMHVPRKVRNRLR